MINTDRGGHFGEAPRCRCTEQEIAAGHRHRCREGRPAYLAVGPWADLTPEEIEAELGGENRPDAREPRDPAE
jgi:hypothetical protein